MADYYSATVIQPALPLIGMSWLEHLLLTTMFQHESEVGCIYLFSELGFDTQPEVSVADLREAFDLSQEVESRMNEPVREVLTARGAPGDDDYITLRIEQAFDDPLYLVILQDIVRRSDEIRWFTVVTAYTCTKMRPDGFGGRAELVTADLVRSRSTGDLIEEFLGEAKLPVR